MHALFEELQRLYSRCRGAARCAHRAGRRGYLRVRRRGMLLKGSRPGAAPRRGPCTAPLGRIYARARQRAVCRRPSPHAVSVRRLALAVRSLPDLLASAFAFAARGCAPSACVT